MNIEEDISYYASMLCS